MARIRIRLGRDEIEIDSRDFYVDNQTAGEVVDSLAKQLRESGAQTNGARPGTDALAGLEEAEAFEPEFAEPRPIAAGEIYGKLQALESESFFDAPRTVSETVGQMRERGWLTSPLEVSKALARMAFTGEILRNSRERRSQYFAKAALLSN